MGVKAEFARDEARGIFMREVQCVFLHLRAWQETSSLRSSSSTPDLPRILAQNPAKPQEFPGKICDEAKVAGGV